MEKKEKKGEKRVARKSKQKAEGEGIKNKTCALLQEIGRPFSFSILKIQKKKQYIGTRDVSVSFAKE